MIQILTIFGLVSWVSAAVFIKGPCPDVKAVENFNITAMTGLWYEIARYPNDLEEKGDCSVDDYMQKNGVVEFKGHEVIDGNVINYEGRIDFAPNAGKSGILNFSTTSEQGSDGIDKAPIHIMHIDYDKYAIMYECQYNKEKDTRHDYSWIMSRSKTIDDDTKIGIENVLKKWDFLDSNIFIWQHFTEEYCKGSLE